MLAFFKKNTGRKIQLVTYWGKPVDPSDDKAVPGVLETDTVSVFKRRAQDGKRSSIVYNIRAEDYRATPDGFEIPDREWIRTEDAENPHILAAFVAHDGAHRDALDALGCYRLDCPQEYLDAERAAREECAKYFVAPETEEYKEYHSHHWALQKRNAAPERYALGTKRWGLGKREDGTRYLVRETWAEVVSLGYKFVD